MFYDMYLSLCNKAGKTPSGAALEIGLSKPTVNRWKNGGGVTDATLKKVADYFGVPVEYLLTDEENADTIVSNVSQYEAILAWTVEQQDVPDRVKDVIQSEIPPNSMGALAALIDETKKDPITDDEVLNELLEIGRAMTPAQRALLVEKANQILGI